MVRRYMALLAVTGAVTGCSNEPLAPPMAASGASFGRGVSSPNTAVTSRFVVYVGGTTYYAGSGPSRNGQGECHTHTDGTVGWYWVPGNVPAGGHGSNGAASGEQENGPNHAQCLFVGGGTAITVSFSEVATYVKATNGNFQLNFNPFCVPNADPSLPDTCYSRDVHYQVSNNRTTGNGFLHGIGVASGTLATSHWSIDLSQINSSSNLIDDPPRQLLVIAHNDEGLYPDSPATVSW